VDDPADASAKKVGKYTRVAGVAYQELKFASSPWRDINFSNFTKVSLEVYVPSSNDYAGDLTKAVSIGIAESSETEQWWTGHVQYDVDEASVEVDKWQTFTFNLDAVTSGPGLGNYTPLTRTDLDMFFISIGGGGHNVGGDFFIRNFKFE
jgi:hypothetical protein